MWIEIKSLDKLEPLQEVSLNGVLKTSKESSFLIDEFPCLVEAEGYEPVLLKEDDNIISCQLLPKELLAYTCQLSYKPGDVMKIFIHSEGKVKIELERKGIKSMVVKSTYVEATRQRTVFDDVVLTGCGWTCTHEFQIPQDAPVGLYGVRILNADMEEFICPVTIESKSTENKLLVVTNTMTWTCYNLWGGRSKYDNLAKKPVASPQELIHPKKSFRSRLIEMTKHLPVFAQKKLRKSFMRDLVYQDWEKWPQSIFRPFVHCGLSQKDPYSPFTNHLADAEWRLLAWLEKCKVNYDIISDRNFEDFNVQYYDAVIISSHSEYWTKEGYDKLKKSNNKGTAILNLSGNSIFGQIEKIGDSALKLISTYFHKSYKDESELMGVRYDTTGYCTAAKYKVIKEKHWIFDKTGLNKNELFGESLNGKGLSNFSVDVLQTGLPKEGSPIIGEGASGWEMDKITVFAPKETILLAKGANEIGGAEMTIIERKNAGLVFSASSMMFTGALLIDMHCSQIILNILSKANINSTI